MVARNYCILLYTLILFSCNDKSPAPSISNAQDSAVGKSGKANALAVYQYHLDKPDRVRRLPDALVEVSGNAWIDSTRLILIEDLHPNLYIVRLTDTAAVLEKTIPFADAKKEKTDIEDVAFTADAVYALWSHGVLFKISSWDTKPAVQKLETGLSKENNTEGLCFDPVTKNLLIACKDNAGEDEEKKSDKAVYQFDLIQNKLITQPFMTIHKKDFRDIAGDKIKFNPSAVAVHPVTHDIYVLTTRDNKGLAVFSHEGVLKSYQPISKDLMPQPEGICFSPGGIMYISSEGKKGEAGNLFEFRVNQ